MKKLKFMLFALIAVFTIGFAYNVNAAQEISEDTTLTEDISDEVVIPEGKTVTLNLGGKTITAPSGKVAITNNGTLIIEGEGNVIADGNYAVSNHGTKLTINGGNYSKTTPASSQSLVANGWINANSNTSEEYSEMVINGGTFDGGSYTAIKNDSYGKMIINNGTVVSTMNISGIQAGVQEAGTSLIINGGTFDCGVYLQNLSSVQDEVKTVSINGGIFNKIVKADAYNGEGVKASRVDLSLSKNAKYNSSINVSNTYSPVGTLAFNLKQFDVTEIGGALSISGRDSENLFPALNLDNMSIGSGLTLSYVEPSTISNSTIKGDVLAGKVTLNKVSAKSLGSNMANNVQDVNNSNIVWVKSGSNHSYTLNIKNSTLGKIAPGSNGNTLMYIDNLNLENVIVTDQFTANVSNTNLATGEIILNGGVVTAKELTAPKVSIPEKSKIDLSFTATGANDIDKILNNRTETNTATTTINLPEGYSIIEDGVVTRPIKDAAISGVNASYQYNKNSIEPVPSLKFLNKDLVKDTDYTVSYENNINAGTASVIIEGKGIYTGKTSKTFTITPINISNYQAVNILDKVYNGRKQTPAVTVSGIEKTDYYVEKYLNNVNVGTATAVVKGKGNYTGTLYKTFKIVKANNPIYVKAVNKNVKAKKIKKKKQVVKGAIVVTKAQGKVTYAKVSGKKNFIVDKNNGKITVKKKTKKGTYKIKVKVNAVGNANYKAGSKTITLTIKVK